MGIRLHAASRRNSSIKFTQKFMMKCFMYAPFFSAENIYVKFLHSDNKYADSKTLGCLAVVWGIKTKSSEDWPCASHMWRAAAHLSEEYSSLQRSRERAFPHQGTFKVDIDTYWRTRIWGKGLHAFMTAATISHNFLIFLKLDNKSINL